MMLRLVFSVCVALLWAATAHAATISITVESGMGSMTGQVEAYDTNGDGILEYSGNPDIDMAGVWDLHDVDILFNPDPVISHSFSVTNLLATTQTFTVTVSTVTGPIGAPTTVTGGSAQFGVTDTNGNGATLSSSGAGTALYTSLLDGGDFVSLYTDPTSAVAGPFGSANVAPLEDFGAPIPSFPGPAVANSIGIRFQFDLTGNDRGTGSGVFVVEPIPEPSTALLVGVGLAGLAAARRRVAR